MLGKRLGRRYAKNKMAVMSQQSLHTALRQADILSASEKVLFTIAVFMQFLFNYSAGIGSTLTNLSIAIFIIVELAFAIAYNRRVLHKEFSAFVAFCVICCVSVLYSADFTLSVGRCSTMLQLMAYALALYSFFSVKTRDRVAFAFRVIVLAGVTSAVYLLTVGNWQNGDRLNDIIGDSNTSGAYLTFVATGIFWGLKTGKLPKVPSLAGLAILTFTVLVNGSRSVFVSFLVGLFAMQVLFSSHRGQISWSKLLGIFLIVGIMAAIIQLTFSNDIFYEILGRRIQSVFEILAGKQSNIHETSVTGRIDLMGNAFSEFAHHPFLGMGINAFVSRYGYFAHNDFLELLATVGLVGFVAFYAQYAFIVRNTLHIQDARRYFLWVVFIQVFITHCFVVFYYQKLEILFIVFLVYFSKIELPTDKQAEN